MRGIYIFFYITLVLLVPLHAVFPAEHQEQKITIFEKNVTWETLLQSLEIKSGYTFSFNPGLFANAGKVNFEAKDETLPEILDRLFQSSPITYTIIQKHIILKSKNTLIRVKGYITNKDGTEKLIGATVMELKNKKGTATTDDGSFILYLSPGEVQLEVSYIGYRRYRQHILSLNRDTTLYIRMEESTHLNDVIITGSEKSPLQFTSPQPGAYVISKETFEHVPVVLGEADIVKTIQTLPGVSSGIEGLAGMYVRGGIGDDNLFIVDGVPIYEVNHLGGLFSPFNVQMVEEAGFYKAGFPAKYGSRLSSVVDIRFKEGDPESYHGTAMIGLTSGGLQLEGPLIKNKTTFNIGLRRSWFDVLSVPALAILNKTRETEQGKIVARYSFQDFNFKINHLLTPKDKLYISGYWSSDFLKGGRETEYEQEQQYSYAKDIARLRWGNLLLLGGWQHQFSHTLVGDLKLAYTSYSSTLKREYNEIQNSNDAQEEGGMLQSNNNGIRDIHIRNEYIFRPGKKHHIKFGAHYTFHTYSPETTNRYFGSSLNKDYQQEDETKGHELSVYAEDDWRAGEKLRVLWGARFNYYKVQEKSRISLESRISSVIDVTEEWEIQSSYSRMSQYIHQLSEAHISLPTDMWLPSTRYFKPQISDQVSAGVKYSGLQGYEFALEGYYKWMHDILDVKDGASTLPAGYGWQDKLTSGRGRAYGMELLVQKNAGRFTGWLGYGLMWADRQFDEINKGAWFPTKFDNRHTLNVTAHYKLRKNVELTGSWHYKTGNRVTLALESYQDVERAGVGFKDLPAYYVYDLVSPGYIERRNNVRLPAYHRLDLGINFYRPKSKGRMGIWHVSIYNAYSRLNPMVIERKNWYLGGNGSTPADSRVEFRTVGLLPILPSVSYTYKF